MIIYSLEIGGIDEDSKYESPLVFGGKGNNKNDRLAKIMENSEKYDKLALVSIEKQYKSAKVSRILI